MEYEDKKTDEALHDRQEIEAKKYGNFHGHYQIKKHELMNQFEYLFLYKKDLKIEYNSDLSFIPNMMGRLLDPKYLNGLNEKDYWLESHI